MINNLLHCPSHIAYCLPSNCLSDAQDMGQADAMGGLGTHRPGGPGGYRTENQVQPMQPLWILFSSSLVPWVAHGMGSAHVIGIGNL